MRFPLPTLLLLSLPLLISAQTCEQFASTSGSECDCPAGFAGSDCSLPVCGATLFAGTGTGRALATNGSVASCECDAGWSGPGCTVCATNLSCGVAYNATGYSPATSSSLLSAGQVANQTMVCNSSPRVYTAGQMSCDVVTPLLQTLFPGSSKLTISRTIDTSLSPIPGLTSPGENSTIYAQLWYENAETFYCKANSCNQTLIAQDSGNSSVFTCQNLECNCMPGTAFCSGVTDLTKTINSLTGELVIQCDATGGTCAFKQTLLVNTFGTAGLALSSCSFGECISQYNLDYLSGTVALTVVSNDLSSGVIAGLCVVGAIVFFALLGLIWGYIAQKKARKSTDGRDEKRPGVGVDWSGVGYEIRLSGNGLGLGRLRLGSKKEKSGTQVEDGLAGTSKGHWKTILAGGEGRVEPGKLVAILGPSGAGKSTLVDLLACRRKSGRTTGKVTFFTSSREKDEGGGGEKGFRPRVGYVDQSDVHSPTSTVREALLLAARLRLPEWMALEEKQARVEEVLSQLGLSHIADSPIGDGNRRGISGGEVRRVSIGLELVSKPHILLLDEPTSGLDSVSAAKVVSVLRDLAHDLVNPTTVIASIHQPSSKLYFSFDSIIVLAKGKQVYNGDGGHAPVDHFVARGGPALPLGYNVADYLLEIASEENLDLLPSSSSMTTFNNPPTSRRPFLHRAPDSNLEKSAIPSSPTSDDADAVDGIHTLHRNDTPSSHNDHSPTQRSSQSDDMIPTNFKPTLKPVSSFLTQFQILCGREWRTIRRDKSLVLAHTLVAIVAGVGSGGLYYQVDLTISGFQNRIGTLFFLGALIAFSSLSALYNLITIRPLFLRERSASYYSPSAWLLARCLWDIIPLRLIPAIILSTITYWMAGLQPHAANYFKFELILILYALGMTLFNFLIAVVISGAGTAILFCSIYNLYLLVYAGFFINLNKIPPVLRWLRYFDTLGYCLEALSVNEVNSGLQIVDELSGVPVIANASLIMSMLFGFGNNYYRDVIVLFVFFIGYLILTVLGVIFVMKERR